MLKRLHIRNYALIEELSIDFSDQLTIITGETGAGKSILLGALGLIMGERADSKIFYNEQQKCIIEGFFEVSAYDLRAFFDLHELDFDNEVVIRRELAPSGKSRAFINDTPVNNQVLQRLTEALIDLHQQFDVLDIHNVNFQLRMIDALADNKVRLKDYQTEFKRYTADQRKLEELVAETEKASREMDFLRFQLQELESATLEAGEQVELENEIARLTHAEDIKQTYGAAYTFLVENDQNIIGQLQEIARSMQVTSKVSGELRGMYERLESAIVELEEIARDAERISEQTEYDPGRIQEIQVRLDVLYKLQKKHSVLSVEALLELQAGFQQQMNGYADLSDQIAQLETSLVQQQKSLKQKAALLSEARKAVIPGFTAKVEAMLATVAMPHARLQVQQEATPHLVATGADDIRFLFASNVGSKFLPIKDVASGGELSRLTLCTKSLVADAIPLPTLIFDEIDTGVSGDVSLKMGLILKELSRRHQVIAITHTPQVAARADRHYFVYKKVEEGRTITNVRHLDEQERVRSIAVMLSGNPPSDSAIVTARELVEH